MEEDSCNGNAGLPDSPDLAAGIILAQAREIIGLKDLLRALKEDAKAARDLLDGMEAKIDHR